MGISSFRLAAGLEKELIRPAQEEGKTKTEVIREALVEYATKKRTQKRFVSVAEAMKGFIAAGRSIFL